MKNNLENQKKADEGKKKIYKIYKDWKKVLANIKMKYYKVQ